MCHAHSNWGDQNMAKVTQAFLQLYSKWMQALWDNFKPLQHAGYGYAAEHNWANLE